MWAVIAVLIVLASAAAFGLKLNADAEHAEAVAAEEEAEAQAAEVADQERRQEEADRSERESRASAVTEIEASVLEMAESHVVDELIEGPIIEVSCDPVNGGSTDDLTQQTTVFQCFAANKDNGDGSLSGHYYNATMNWDSQEYTYGFGEP